MTENPYQTSETHAAPPQPPALDAKSSVPKVFAIIHFVYAVLGLLTGAAALANPILTGITTKPIIEAAQNAGKSTAAYEAAVSEVTRYGMINGVIQFILAILLAIAGFNLLKYRLKGAQLSKLWALIRIPVAIMIGTLSMGATKAMMVTQAELMDTGGEAMSGMMNMMGTFSVIINVIFVCIYPVITLTFMTRKKVLASLK